MARPGRNIRWGPRRPLPPYIGRSGGGRVRERELGPRDHVTSYVILRPCHVTISGQRGGGTHLVIGHVTQASSAERCVRSVYSYPMQWKGCNTHLFSVHTRQAHIRPRRLFFAYSTLNINFKGVPVHMKLKIVALEISVE